MGYIRKTQKTVAECNDAVTAANRAFDRTPSQAELSRRRVGEAANNQLEVRVEQGASLAKALKARVEQGASLAKALSPPAASKEASPALSMTHACLAEEPGKSAEGTEKETALDYLIRATVNEEPDLIEEAVEDISKNTQDLIANTQDLIANAQGLAAENAALREAVAAGEAPPPPPHHNDQPRGDSTLNLNQYAPALAKKIDATESKPPTSKSKEKRGSSFIPAILKSLFAKIKQITPNLSRTTCIITSSVLAILSALLVICICLV